VAILERRGPIGYDIKFLDDAHGPYTVGRSKDIDLVIDGDDSISAVHAELQRKGPAWCIDDLGSTNGTFVNEDRIVSKRVLHDGDVIRLGRTTLTLRDGGTRTDGTTKRTTTERPEITRTERLVLIELCRPVMSGKAFTPPASVDTIAKALFVGAAAVRAHLVHLYDKFVIQSEEGVSRRVLLANAAIETGVVTTKDLE
jgi:pSer/pThr/pTyr-binding forkhead associated (FHA) protein